MTEHGNYLVSHLMLTVMTMFMTIGVSTLNNTVAHHSRLVDSPPSCIADTIYESKYDLLVYVYI